MIESSNEDEPAPHGESTSDGSVSERLRKLGANLDEINRVKRKYPMKIAGYYLGLIRERGDPIWRQCVPSQAELEDDFNVEDPLMEEDCTPVPYLVHKYPDRVLLLAASTCAMYCRFCTRKRKVGRIRQIPLEDIFRAIDYIGEHEEVRDVIVSGGDPLTRPIKEIEEILKRLRAIPHVQIIRIGTRIPCVRPELITPRLARTLAKYHPIYMNLHFNHPAEITPESTRACALLADAGIPLGSQTVLLRGINDNPEVMKELMQKLIAIRVKPYYIYQCDLVKGVEHFRTPVQTGIDIMKRLQGVTSGLCVPHFVIDGPGGKIPVSPQYVKGISDDQIFVTNYEENLYSYPGLRTPLEGVGARSGAPKKVTRIGLAFNLKREVSKGERSDKYAEFDDIGTINAVRRAIEGAGYEVVLLEADRNFVDALRGSNVDFVFNIAEGIGGESRESHVPAILEMLSIPYSGSGILAQAITLNKSRKKEILTYHGIPTPKFQLFTNGHQRLREDMQYPLMVKPDAEGSSVGITNDSLVFNMDNLMRMVTSIRKIYSQKVLVEEFCSGREFTVALLGNGRPRVMPIVEILYDHLPEGIAHFDSYEAKWIYDNPASPHDPLVVPANISPRLRTQIERLAVSTFNLLGCVDYCRIDIRLDAGGVPNVLDVNALPGIMPDPRSNSRFTRACYAAGMTYDGMVLAMLDSGLGRYDLLR